VESLSAALQLDESAERSGHRPLLASSKAEAHFQLRWCSTGKAAPQKLIQQYRAALEVEKDFDGALNNLAWIFAANPNNDVRNGLEAVQLAERACQLTHDLTTTYIGTLAAAYAEAGPF